MKTITVEQFKNIVSNGKWTHEQHIDIVEDALKPSRNEDCGTEDYVKEIWGVVTTVSKCDDIIVKYNEQWSCIEGVDESLSAQELPEFVNKYEIEGVKIIDGNGDEIADIGDELGRKFSHVDYDVLFN